MNKFTRFLGMFFTLTLFLFCFTGCTVFPSSGGGSGPSGGGSGPDDPRVDPVIDPVEPPKEQITPSVFDEGYFDAFQQIYYGVRTVYRADTNREEYKNASNEQLQNDRIHYDEAIAKQYNLISTYILYELLGEYGKAIGSNWVGTLDVYLDESYLPLADYDIDITASGLSPLVLDDSTFQTHSGAIEYAINGVDIDIDSSDNSYTFVPKIDTNFAWKCSLGLPIYNGTDYISTYLNKFVPYLQIRLMEIELEKLNNLPNSYTMLTLTSFNTMNTATISTRISELALLFDKMGVDYTPEHIVEVVDLIKNEIIGSNALNRESASLSLQEVFTWNSEGTDYTANIDINGDSAYTPNFVSTTLYKYDYITILTRIVNEIYNDNTVNVQNFPTFDRREIVDDQSTKFFTPGIEGDTSTPSKLTNMDYQVYESAILYDKDNTFPWFLILSLDSVEDITTDVYVRMCKNGIIYNVFLGTMHTDHTKDYIWSNTDDEDEESEIDHNTLIANTQTWELSERLCATFDESLSELPADYTTLMSEGLATYNVDLLAPADSYKGFAGYKMPTYSHYVPGPTDVKKGAETVDLSHLLVCGDTDYDFLELVFDVQKPDTDAEGKNYTFKFLVQVVDMVASDSEE